MEGTRASFSIGVAQKQEGDIAIVGRAVEAVNEHAVQHRRWIAYGQQRQRDRERTVPGDVRTRGDGRGVASSKFEIAIERAPLPWFRIANRGFSVSAEVGKHQGIHHALAPAYPPRLAVEFSTRT